jgi:Vacuolar protein sorting-associated protein 62
MNASHPYGDVLVTFSSEYDLRYPDWGSGADRDGSFWHPRGGDGFRPLGSIVIAGYDDPTGRRASMLVKDNGNAAVAAPVDYDWIWDDSGSGADWDGSVWRPRPPAGYISLGDVAVSNHGKPSVDDVWCVRADLVTDGTIIDPSVWDDRGSGGDHDLSAWQVEAAGDLQDSNRGAFAPDTFLGCGNYDRPQAGLARVLYLPIPAEVLPVPGRPLLTSRDEPALTTDPVLDRRVRVPFTAFFDRTDVTALQHIANPFCDLERWANYTLIAFDDNRTQETQETGDDVQVGVTRDESETFSHTVGVKIGAEVGIEGVGKATTELSYQFGYSKTHGISELESTTVHRKLSTPPGHAGAMWAASYSYRVVRADGTHVGRDLSFNVESFVHDQYPAAVNGAVATLSVA